MTQDEADEAMAGVERDKLIEETGKQVIVQAVHLGGHKKGPAIYFAHFVPDQQGTGKTAAEAINALLGMNLA